MQGEGKWSQKLEFCNSVTECRPDILDQNTLQNSGVQRTTYYSCHFWLTIASISEPPYILIQRSNTALWAHAHPCPLSSTRHPFSTTQILAFIDIIFKPALSLNFSPCHQFSTLPAHTRTFIYYAYNWIALFGFIHRKTQSACFLSKKVLHCAMC